jgi:hypothetical protein
LARAKNTSRAEARKRTREAQRAELAAEEQLDDQPQTTDAPAPRPRIFQMPNVLDDLRALPGIFRTRRLIWLPFILVAIGLVLTLLLFGLPAELQQLVLFYIQFMFVPQGLFAYFIAGFLAPRASYLVGAAIGAFTGLSWVIVTMTIGLAATGEGIGVVEEAARPPFAINELVVSVVLGTLAAAFAAWYRGFLRNMQTSGQQRRAEREARERAKRREERQEARRVYKQRPG